ncbi:MAG TPA: Ig-like domain-containing protein, partial [Thermoanaerobaculia bacterium]|nr:Ig-like domain-containing protein [Thermoanaerobaculia bacterium]
MKLRLSAALLFILLTVLPLAADKVLILGTTGGASSQEAVEALALLPAGSTVDVAPTEAAFNALAASGGFSAYRVVIVADPNCGQAPVTPTLAPNWAKDITGNVIIVGTDQYTHRASGGTKLVQQSMAYILSKPQTGAFISLSCYYDYPTAVPVGTPVPFLDNAFASSAGSFTVHGTSVAGCLNDAYLTATHPALAALTNADLDFWNCSVHEAFDTWPLDFVVLAIAKNSGSSYTAPDGTVGSPYILARGDIAVISNITLGPAVAVNELGKTHTVTATINPPVAGVTVTFKVVTGPNVGLTGTGVTNAGGQATFTYTSTTLGVDFIQAQFTRAGVTQTSNLVRKEWVHTPKSCMRILQSKVLCETDANGVPTGNYIWQFRVHNTSGTPVSHLFISGLTSPVTATPDHIIFSPALGGGVSALQQVVIKNAPPGPLTLMISLHDSRLEHCCSAEVTLDLPECDCAQMVKEATPACYSFPLSFVPPPYKYTFTIQNLSSILAQKVLVAAVSPIDLITPVPTSQLQVAAAVNNIPATGPGASAGPLTLNIGGPLAVGGQKVCLNISVNDKDIDDCCSITRCFTLPACSRDLDDHVGPIGGATFTAFGTGFRIGGFGSTGEDGVRIDTGEAERVGVAWEPLDAAAPNGAFIELRASTGLGEPG